MGNTSSENSNQATKFLYHLGKGLWKSVPVLGPLVEELAYEQFRDSFLGEVQGMSEAEIQRIVAAIPPGMDEQQFDQALALLSANIMTFTQDQFSRISVNLQLLSEETAESLKEIEEQTSRLSMMQDIISEIRERVEDTQSVDVALQIIENQRQKWTERISENQVLLLSHMPDAYTFISIIWDICLTIIPACTYKEFRFRLHELEWLGLVERYWHGNAEAGQWKYRRTKAGRARVPGCEGGESFA